MPPRSECPGLPELGLKHRPDLPGVEISAYDWMTKPGERWDMYNTIPEFASLTTNEEKLEFAAAMADRNAFNEEVNADIQRDRERRELYNSWDNSEEGWERYLARYNAMSAEEQEEYDKWEEMWEELQTRDRTAAKGLPAWEELLKLGLAQDPRSAGYFSKMDSEETSVYGKWAHTTIDRLRETAGDLQAAWASPAVNAKRNREHWAAYRKLPETEKLFYDIRIAGQLADKMINNQEVDANELYDKWRNTGGSQAPAWQHFRAQVIGRFQEKTSNISQQIDAIQEKFEIQKIMHEIDHLGLSTGKTAIPNNAAELLETATEFRRLFVLHRQDRTAYNRDLASMDWGLFRAYTLWERTQG